MVHELSRRLDALWRDDRFIANAGSRPVMQVCWRDFTKQELESVTRRKELMKEEIQNGCF